MNMLLILHRKTLTDLDSLFSLSLKKKKRKETSCKRQPTPIFLPGQEESTVHGVQELDIVTNQQQSANVSSTSSHR